MTEERQWRLRKVNDYPEWSTNACWQFENETEEIALCLYGGTPQQRQRILDYLNQRNSLKAEAAKASRYREALERIDSGIDPASPYDIAAAALADDQGGQEGQDG